MRGFWISQGSEFRYMSSWKGPALSRALGKGPKKDWVNLGDVCPKHNILGQNIHPTNDDSARSLMFAESDPENSWAIKGPVLYRAF